MDDLKSTTKDFQPQASVQLLVCASDQLWQTRICGRNMTYTPNKKNS
jgi:hypothetical protein